VWCYVMGQACSLAATMDPAANEFKANMDNLNAFMRDRGLPQSLKKALRTYFHNSRSMQRQQSDSHVINMMSPLMQATVALQANQSWLNRIWFLRADWYQGFDADRTHSSFVAAIAQKLKASAYIAQERVAGGMLYIVHRGLAIKRWRMISRGKVFGEDMILDNKGLIDYSEAVAMTYLEVYTLDRPSLEACCRLFPDCGTRIHAAARRMLIQRLVVQYMCQAAGKPVKSFQQLDVQMHALPEVSLEQKVDMVIGALVASPAAQPSVGGGAVVEEASSGAVVEAGGDGSTGCGSGRPTNEPPASATRKGHEHSPAPAPSAPVLPPAPPSAATDSARSSRQPLSSQRASGIPPDAAAAASFAKLLAMHQECLHMQASMGEELARVSAAVNGGGSPGLLPPGAAMFDRGIARMSPTPLRSMGVIKEASNKEEHDWAASARRFLPAWAASRSPDDNMSA